VKLKKKISQKKTPRKKKKPYFGKEAHKAIVEYQLSSCREEKNKIYTNKIKQSFDKLTENLIFIHGFSSNEENFKILKSDCVAFLYEILNKFDPSKGSKAFSYFNVCAKNFLIIQSKKKSKSKSRMVSINDDKLSLIEKKTIENYQVISSQEDVMIFREDKKILKEVFKIIEKRTSNQNELLCIKAIDTLFEKVEELDFLNKRAIFVYLREISGLNAKQLSVAMSNIRKNYKDIVKSNDNFILFATKD
tara:strand:- start:232 stop:975 length:744 start_codon:yes stop_codon:yes gene_type:complete